MPLKTQLIQKFDKDHERLMWEALAFSLTEALASHNTDGILLGNFHCGRQIDALFIKTTGLCVIELKAYSGRLHVPVNGEWYADDIEIASSGGINPLEQVRKAKFAIVDRLKAAWKTRCPAESPEWRCLAGRVVFNPPISFENGFDHGIKLWFDICDTQEAGASLLKFRSRDFAFSPSDMDFICEAVLGTPIATPRRVRLLYFNEPTFNAAFRSLLGIQGEAQTAANLFSGYKRILQIGRNPLSDVPFQNREEISGLRVHKITATFRLAVIHHDGKNYLANIGSENHVENWISLNKGLQYVVDINTDAIVRTWIDQDRSDIPTVVTSDNKPFMDRIEGVIDDLGATKSDLAPVLELNEDSGADERTEAIEKIKDDALRPILRDLIELVRTGDNEAALARLKVFTGQAAPVQDVPNLHEEAIDSPVNSEALVDWEDLSPESFEKLLQGTDDDKWMCFLHPGQERVVEETFGKPAILTGVSGSGKTAVLMHRARRMTHLYPGEKILVLALNKSLAEMIYLNLQNLCSKDEMENIRVMSFHQYLGKMLSSLDIRHFLQRLGEYTRHEIAIGKMLQMSKNTDLPLFFSALDESELKSLFEDFSRTMEGSLRDTFNNLEIYLYSQDPGLDTTAYIYEELELVRSAFPCFDDYGAYLKGFERTGRAINFQENRKKQVLELLHAWEQRQIELAFLDHMGLSQAALLAVEEKGGIPVDFRYRCVLVDEFQDFSTLDLKILAKISTHPENGLFLTGDLAQKLYAKQLDLRKANLGQSERVFRFIRKNYRNTKQILLAADTLIKAYPPKLDADAEITLLDPQLASRESAKPTAYQCEDPIRTAWRDAALWISSGYPSQAVCIVSTNTAKYPLEEIVNSCPGGLDAVELSGWHSLTASKVIVSDAASIKGFEFRLVLLIGAEEGVFPAKGRHQDELWRDAQRLYVAITRGRDEVRFFYKGTPSVFLSRMADTIAWEHAAPLPVKSPQLPEAKEEEKKVAIVAPPQITKTFEDGTFFKRSSANGYHFLTFKRRPNQPELAFALGVPPNYVNLALIQDSNLALVPRNQLEKHLVEKISLKKGVIAEFRDFVIDLTPEPSLEKPSLPIPIADALPAKLPVSENDCFFAGFTLSPRLRTFTQNRSTFTGELLNADISEYRLTGEKSLELLLHDIRFKNGERYFTCGSRCESLGKWERIVNRLRQGARCIDNQNWIMDLRQARLKENGWSNRFGATREQLKLGAGIDVLDQLRVLGATNLGTKQEVYGETNKTRGWLCVQFSSDNPTVGLAAYVLTTVAPIANEYPEEG